jgi:hypothetical protein
MKFCCPTYEKDEEKEEEEDKEVTAESSLVSLNGGSQERYYVKDVKPI